MTCGNCVNCVRKGTHLRCGKFGFSVTALGICRSGWEKKDEPLNAQEHPLLVKEVEDFNATYGYDAEGRKINND